MGTEAQRAHRKNYIDKRQSIIDAVIRGDWADDSSLKDYLESIGAPRDKALFNQFGSEGGFAHYGPSWDPGWKNDFNTDEEIPHMGEGETWYDPSVASNWRKTDPLKAKRMAGFFDWRDKNIGNIGGKYGNNMYAAWHQMRANSDRPNAPDMSWFTEGSQKGTPTITPPATSPTLSPTLTTNNASRIPGKPQPAKPVDPALTGALPTTPSIAGNRRTAATSARRTPAWYSSWKF